MLMTLASDGQLPIFSEGDLIVARKLVRNLTTAMGFSVTDITRIVTATSELTRNILLYAGFGTMAWQRMGGTGRKLLELVFVDKGSGIADIDQVMRPGFSTSGGLGLGLPGAKRLMDEMEIKTVVGQGTEVVIRKYLRGR
jgi:serine/threonine-protein kinase RsbT